MPSFHRIASSLFDRVVVNKRLIPTIGPITLAYRDRVASGNIRLDDDQLATAGALDDLYRALCDKRDRIGVPNRYAEALAAHYGGGVRGGIRGRWSGAGIASATAASTATTMTTTKMTSTTWRLVDDVAAFALPIARCIFDPPPPRGAYVYGSVGVGKSMLVDMFHTVCSRGFHAPPPTAITETERDDDVHSCRRASLSSSSMIMPPIPGGTRRYHFHEFMLDVHGRIHDHRRRHPKSDPIPPVAASFVSEAKLLCLDEMQITDIADAMIMKRLMTILLDMGVVVVTTSNRPPWGLYEGGINRDAFLPFVDTLRERMVVIGMGGDHDYRDDRAAAAVADDDDGSFALPRYLCPSLEYQYPLSREEIIDIWFTKGGGTTRIENVPVIMGRSIIASRANDACAIFDFHELCDRPIGAADYIAISSRYATIIIVNVPRLTGDIYDCARRFVIFVDAAYEARTRLIIDAAVPRDALFVGFDAEVTTNDGDEEIVVKEDDGTRMIGSRGNEESMIVGEGGSSSSSSTTFLRTKDGDGRVEWSATGRVGVSLAQLSAVREVSFSFKRAESRLGEMASPSWGR